MLPLLFSVVVLAEVPASPAPDAQADRRVVEAIVAEFVAAWNRGDETLPHVRNAAEAARHRRDHTRLELDVATLQLQSSPSRTAYVTGTLVGVFRPSPGTLWPFEPWKQHGARSPIAIGLMRRSGEPWTIIVIRSAWNAPRAVA